MAGGSRGERTRPSMAGCSVERVKIILQDEQVKERNPRNPTGEDMPVKTIFIYRSE